MRPLSPRRAEFLEFIRAHVKAHGVSPSFDEIGRAVGARSKNTVARVVYELQHRGYIRILPRRARSIQLVATEDHHAADCLCRGCAVRRYQHQQQLVDAIANLPPAGFPRGDNFRPLSAFKRLEWLTRLPQSGSDTAPTLRKEAP